MKLRILFVCMALAVSLVAGISPANAAAVPAKITILQLTTGPGQATARWSAPAANGATIHAYVIASRRYYSGSNQWSPWTYAIVSGSVRATVVYRPGGGQIEYKVKAANRVGQAAWSDGRRVTVPKAPTGPYDYKFPIPRCKVSYASSHHHYPATDMFAARGCPFVAPTAGTIDEVSRDDNWSSSTNLGKDRGGRFVSMVGYDGVRYYGSHLTTVTAGIRVGSVVRAGQSLGTVGNTGSARGVSPHVHFGLSWPTRPEVWSVRRGKVAPAWFLNGWRAGVDPSPSNAVARALAKAGTPVPRCTSYC